MEAGGYKGQGIPSGPSRPLRVLLGVAALFAAAGATALLVRSNYQVGLGIVGVAGAAVLCARYPAASVTAVALITGAYGSLTAFWNVPAGPAADLILGGLWVATLWHLVRHRRPQWWVPPAVVAVVAYLALTAVQIAFASSAPIGLQSFRASAWYLAAGVLVAYAPWSHATRRRIVNGVLLVCLGVGTYAVSRWLFGAAPQEANLAKQVSYTNTLDGELGLVGSLTSRHELGGWTGLAVPFCFAMTLTLRDRWRLVAVAAATACMFALLASETRAALVSVIPALVLVLLLYQFSRGFPGLHLGATAVAAIAIVGIGVFQFSGATGDSTRAKSHFELILTPSQDPAYRRRVYKWDTALADIARHPMGQGLGTAGRVQQQHGRFANVASINVDSSYLKIAYEQGTWVMVFVIATLVALLASLIRRALVTPDRERAGIAIAGAAALLCMGLLMVFGTYIEGLPALLAWLLVGLGIGAVAQRAG
jgi:uncharacterized membrane protein YoaK (UPF0700 family)